MSERILTYFVSDVHLGLDVNNPRERESRFVSFLNSIPKEKTESLYMLGDIWDFWYEYRDVVPKGYVRVFAALMDLMDAGVNVYFFRGNHDIWVYGYLQEMGITVLSQPYFTEIAGKRFCLGHGDGLGPGKFFYKVMRRCFYSPVLQFFFSLLHPYLAFRLGNTWSKRSRLGRMKRRQEGKCHPAQKELKLENLPIYTYSSDVLKNRDVDYFVFGHYHFQKKANLSTSSEIYMLGSWLSRDSYLYFDGISMRFGYSPKIEK